MKRAAFTSFVVLSVGVFVLSGYGQEAAPRIIKGGVLNGKATSLPKPEYPAEARAAGIEGRVIVDVVIDETGAVTSAVAAVEPRKDYKLRSTNADEPEIPPADPILRDAAERAAMKAKFSPTRLSGEPVKVTGTIVYNFVARNEISHNPVNGGILNGKAISLPQPIYPDAARAVRACGPVTVSVTIDENGDVISASAVSGHPLLRSAAVEAAQAAKFSPTTLEGKPVTVAGVLTYNFLISDGECSR